jgi:hypothetical protein
MEGLLTRSPRPKAAYVPINGAAIGDLMDFFKFK